MNNNDNDKFTIDAKWIFRGLGYSGNGFAWWFRTQVDKLDLKLNEDFIAILAKGGNYDRMLRRPAAFRILASVATARKCAADKLLIQIHGQFTLPPGASWHTVRQCHGGGRTFRYKGKYIERFSCELQNGDQRDDWLKEMIAEDVPPSAEEPRVNLSDVRASLGSRQEFTDCVKEAVGIELINGVCDQIVLPPPEPLPAFSEREVAAGPCPQCDGVCPMPMSPHYQPELAPRILNGAPGEDCTTHDHEPTPAAEAVVVAATGDLIPREIDGFVIPQRTKDGYVNATAMCKAAGKLIGHWSQNNDTKKVLASLSPVIGIPITGNSDNGERGLVIIRQGGRPEEQGTWVHPTVALHLANWCSSDFYAAVLTWTISEWASGNKPSPAPVFQIPTTLAGALRLAADTSEANEQLKLENAQLGTDLAAREEQVEFMEKVVEAVKTSEERTVDTLMARMDVSVKAIPPTKFFKQTASILGYSSVEGFAYLIAAGIFSKPVKNEWGTNQYEPMVPHDKCGYFQPSYQTNHRSMYDEQGYKTDVVRNERLVTYHLTTDKIDKAGNIIKIGGFRWLMMKMMHDWRTLLNRMIAATGGEAGEFGKLAGAVTKKVRDNNIPGVDSYKEFCVIISDLPSGGCVCAHKTHRGRIVRSEGVTQLDAFVKLNAQL